LVFGDLKVILENQIFFPYKCSKARVCEEKQNKFKSRLAFEKMSNKKPMPSLAAIGNLSDGSYSFACIYLLIKEKKLIFKRVAKSHHIFKTPDF